MSHDRKIRPIRAIITVVTNREIDWNQMYHFKRIFLGDQTTYRRGWVQIRVRKCCEHTCASIALVSLAVVSVKVFSAPITRAWRLPMTASFSDIFDLKLKASSSSFLTRPKTANWVICCATSNCASRSFGKAATTLFGSVPMSSLQCSFLTTSSMQFVAVYWSLQQNSNAPYRNICIQGSNQTQENWLRGTSSSEPQNPK